MKRAELERHLRLNGCQLAREGKEHAIWINPGKGLSRQLHAIPQSKRIRPAKFVKILGFRDHLVSKRVPIRTRLARRFP